MEECIDRLVDGQEIADARCKDVKQDYMSWQGCSGMNWQMGTNPLHGIYEEKKFSWLVTQFAMALNCVPL
jgi:hypothetical protein